MTTRYEVIKADSPEEAEEKSRFKVGDICRCTELEKIANSDGTYTVIPIVEPYRSGEDR